MSRLIPGYHLYQNKSDDRFWAIYKIKPDKYYYTRWSYVEPLTALKKLVYKQNTNLIGSANNAQMNLWLSQVNLQKVNGKNMINMVKPNSNLYKHLHGAAVLSIMSRKK
jgi:hypothetical protein